MPNSLVKQTCSLCYLQLGSQLLEENKFSHCYPEMNMWQKCSELFIIRVFHLYILEHDLLVLSINQNREPKAYATHLLKQSRMNEQVLKKHIETGKHSHTL